MTQNRKILWAYFRRWLYLLCYGMWRGEVAYTVKSPWHTQIAAATDFTQTTYRETKCFYNGPP